MRLMIDGLVALMLIAILGGVAWHHREHTTQSSQRELCRSEVRRFQQQIALQAALATVQRNARGFPSSVELHWFTANGGTLPENPLLTDSHPWLEIAGPQDKDMLHPLQRIATNTGVAKYWYNPHNGIVRARIPATISDSAARELYCYINDCELSDVFAP